MLVKVRNFHTNLSLYSYSLLYTRVERLFLLLLLIDAGARCHQSASMRNNKNLNSIRV